MRRCRQIELERNKGVDDYNSSASDVSRQVGLLDVVGRGGLHSAVDTVTLLLMPLCLTSLVTFAALTCVKL